MMLRGGLILLAMLALLAWGAVPARAQDDARQWTWCAAKEGEVDPDLSLGACTALIQSGRLDTHNLAIAYTNRCGAYLNKGQYDRAIMDLDQAIRLDPNLAIAYSNRGNAYAHKGQYDRAIADYDQAIRLDPNKAGRWNSRCWARALLGDLPAALADCNQALRLDPGNANALDSRGLVHLKRGDYPAAADDYSAALAIRPNYAHGLYGRALAYAGLNDKAAAARDWAAALTLDANIERRYETYHLDLAALSPAATGGMAAACQELRSLAILAQERARNGDRFIAEAARNYQDSYNSCLAHATSARGGGGGQR